MMSNECGDEGWEAARADLDSIARLKDNWDGYNGAAPHPGAVENGHAFMDLLFKMDGEPPETIYPEPHGVVSFEWGSSNELRDGWAVCCVGSTRWVGFVQVGDHTTYHSDLTDNGFRDMVEGLGRMW